MLDENGNVIMELPYKVRYLNADAEEISKEEYYRLLELGQTAYRADFVGCTYHCG